MTFVLGLTGSIAMGKSATAEMFRRCGVPVHDADAVVHDLYAGEAAPLIEKAFPGTVVDGRVDRGLLGAVVFGAAKKFAKLEAIVHPLVRREEEIFLEKARKADAPLAVLDIPLLFETGADRRCRAVAVVSAPQAVQRQRVLARPGMTEKKLAAILAKQMPDSEKRARAHFIIETNYGFENARRQIEGLIRCVAGR